MKILNFFKNMLGVLLDPDEDREWNEQQKLNNYLGTSALPRDDIKNGLKCLEICRGMQINSPYQLSQALLTAELYKNYIRFSPEELKNILSKYSYFKDMGKELKGNPLDRLELGIMSKIQAMLKDQEVQND